MMNKHKIIALIFIAIAAVLGSIFISGIATPEDLAGYFKPEYYTQFGPLAICVELLIAGIYLFLAHRSANFTLALFAFATLLDFLLNLFGVFNSTTPPYAMGLFLICAIVALWLAFDDVFELGRISLLSVLGSFVLGLAIELFFNYL